MNTLSRETPHQIFVPLSPFEDGDIKTYKEAQQIDKALMDRYIGRKAFKVGAEERVVYERVSNLKRVSINHSLLYSFCSEGAFSEFEIPVTLYRPTPLE